MVFGRIGRFLTTGYVAGGRPTAKGVTAGLTLLAGSLYGGKTAIDHFHPTGKNNNNNKNDNPIDDKSSPLATPPGSPDDAVNSYNDINTKLQQTGNENNAKLLQQQALQYSIVASANNLKALSIPDDKIKDLIEKALKGDNNLLTVNGEILSFDTPGLPKLPPGYFPVRLSNGEIIGEQKYALSLDKQEVRLLDLGTGRVHILDYDIQDPKKIRQDAILAAQARKKGQLPDAAIYGQYNFGNPAQSSDLNGIGVENLKIPPVYEKSFKDPNIRFSAFKAGVLTPRVDHNKVDLYAEPRSIHGKDYYPLLKPIMVNNKPSKAYARTEFVPVKNGAFKKTTFVVLRDGTEIEKHIRGYEFNYEKNRFEPKNYNTSTNKFIDDNIEPRQEIEPS